MALMLVGGTLITRCVGTGGDNRTKVCSILCNTSKVENLSMPMTPAFTHHLQILNRDI